MGLIKNTLLKVRSRYRSLSRLNKALVVMAVLVLLLVVAGFIYVNYQEPNDKSDNNVKGVPKTLTAKLLYLEGSAELGIGSNLQEAKSGSSIKVGQTLEVPGDSKAVVLISGSSYAVLDQNSSVQFKKIDTSEVNIELVSGSIYSVISGSDKLNYSISRNGLKVSAEGTEFLVKYLKDLKNIIAIAYKNNIRISYSDTNEIVEEGGKISYDFNYESHKREEIREGEENENQMYLDLVEKAKVFSSEQDKNEDSPEAKSDKTATPKSNSASQDSNDPINQPNQGNSDSNPEEEPTPTPTPESTPQPKPEIILPFSINPDSISPLGETLYHSPVSHSGIDFQWRNPSEVPSIISSMEGEVAGISHSSYWTDAYDLSVRNGDYYVVFSELESYNTSLSVGSHVSRGDYIGKPQHPPPQEDLPNFRMIHWEFGYFKESDPIFGESLCPLTYFTSGDRSRIESIWANTDNAELKANAPYVCSGSYYGKNE